VLQWLKTGSQSSHPFTQSNPIQSNPIRGWIQSMSNSGPPRGETSEPMTKTCCRCIKLINIVHGVHNRACSVPELNRTRALRQLYSAESTWRALSFSTCSWKMRMWSMNATTRSAAIGLAWRPAAASSGATCRGIEHWAAFNTNNSLQANRNSATWSVTYTEERTKIFISPWLLSHKVVFTPKTF